MVVEKRLGIKKKATRCFDSGRDAAMALRVACRGIQIQDNKHHLRACIDTVYMKRTTEIKLERH